MALPALVVQEQGQGTVSADNLNTTTQSGYLAAQLRNFVGVTYMTVILTGIFAANDGLGGVFQWFDTTSAVDDGINTIVPYAAQSGAWIRVSILSGSSGLGPQYLLNRTITATPVISALDYGFLCDASGASFSIVLPSAALNKYRRIQTVKIDATTNQVVVTDGTNTLGTLAFAPILGMCQSITWWSDGTVWRGV